MAQKNKILLPVLFDFRVAKFEWTQVVGHVIGWKWNKGIEDPTFLAVKIDMGLGNSDSRYVPFARLPATLQKQCLATLGKSKADLRVNQICSDFELTFFQSTGEPKIGDVEIKKHTKPGDPWLMRRDFLRVKPNKSFGAFLNKWGRWKGFGRHVEEQEMFDLQKMVRYALISPPDKWLSSGFAKVRGSGSSGLPFTMLTDECHVAICTTTTFDLLRKRKFKTCALSGCGAPYEVKSNKLFCCQACAHLYSVRKSRETAKAKQAH